MTMESSILASVRAGIVAIRLDGTVAYLNPIGAKILETHALREGDSIHNRAWENSFFRVLSEAVSMNYLPSRVEVELPGRDGDRQHLGFTLSELRERGEKVGICAFFKDLTQVEMAEESENLTQRLVLLGQMAAGLAHEIRNPIASIGVHCGILRSHLAGNEKLIPSVSMMTRELEKVESIIRECLNFVRPAELRTEIVRVDEIVENVIRGLKAVHPVMEFRVKRPDDASLDAEVDRGLLEQAIANILVNATEACEGKGTVTVSFGFSRHFIEMDRAGRGTGHGLPGFVGVTEDFVRIGIRDDGPGIPSEVKDRIFVPFFTTKRKGTGLGLPLVQKIVHAHSGILDLQSEPGQGTEFTIKIPMRQKSGRQDPGRRG
ncbi:MAG: ATP-binding protein [Deltaproteobacteria bacterium]|nr:ATP-binding protein [Deltaproteobacteria bacterium]